MRDKAIKWLDSQPIASITTWNDLAQNFYTMFFPSIKIAKLKYDISIFRQGDFETFDEAGIGSRTCYESSTSWNQQGTPSSIFFYGTASILQKHG